MLDYVEVYHASGSGQRAVDFALAYVAEGWGIIALKPAGKSPLYDRDLQPHGANSATRDPAVIRARWTLWPDANIGGVLPESLAVVDFDPRNYDERTKDWLAVYRPQLPATRRHVTGGGGEHLIYRTSSRFPLMVDHKVNPELPRGIDVLGVGHIVVLPPSLHASGRLYTVADARDFSDAPALLVRLVERPKSSPAARKGDARRDVPGWLTTIRVGERYKRLKKYAAWRRGCGDDEDMILAHLREVVATRVEQPVGDVFPDREVQHLARWAARFPVGVTGWRLKRQYAPVIDGWTGRTAATDAHVFLFAVVPLFAWWWKRGKATAVELAKRTVAPMAGVGEDTAMKSIRRLEEVRGVIRRTRLSDGEHGAMYRLVNPALLATSDTTPPPKRRLAVPSVRRRDSYKYLVGSGVIPPGARDLFRRCKGSLGPLARDAYVRLTMEGQTAGEIGEHCVPQRDRRGVRKALIRLREHDLAVEGSDGWRLGPADVVGVAKRLGVFGKTTAQKMRIATERKHHRSAEGKKQREANRTERMKLQAEVKSLACALGYPGCGTIEASKEAWRAFTKKATRKALTQALVALRDTPCAGSGVMVDVGSIEWRAAA